MKRICPKGKEQHEETLQGANWGHGTYVSKNAKREKQTRERPRQRRI